MAVRIKIRIALALAAAGSAGACSSNEAGPAMPVDVTALYGQMCARCHGPDGKGAPDIKQTMPVRDFTDPTFRARANAEELERVIMSGRNQMPGFGGALSAPKIQALAGYVMRLSAGQGARK
jgi:mono/diheme cytochrome c family protein